MVTSHHTFCFFLIGGLTAKSKNKKFSFFYHPLPHQLILPSVRPATGLDKLFLESKVNSFVLFTMFGLDIQSTHSKDVVLYFNNECKSLLWKGKWACLCWKQSREEFCRGSLTACRSNSELMGGMKNQHSINEWFYFMSQGMGKMHPCVLLVCLAKCTLRKL